jgi:acetyl-CoA carboxylase beta subunit
VKVELLTVPATGGEEEEEATGGGAARQLVWVTHNFSFLGGSLGCAEGEKITRAFEYATEHKVSESVSD